VQLSHLQSFKANNDDIYSNTKVLDERLQAEIGLSSIPVESLKKTGLWPERRSQCDAD
jgi:hypothetical protein